MKFFKHGWLILTVVMLLMALAGCGESGKTGTAATTPPAGEPAYAFAMAEALLQAIDDGDYGAFSKNFDEAMKLAMTEVVFSQLKDLIRSKIGTYSSMEFVSVQAKDGYTVVTYKAKYSNEPGDVTVAVTFSESGGTALVSGLWFDSPKLREK